MSKKELFAKFNIVLNFGRDQINNKFYVMDLVGPLTYASVNLVSGANIYIYIYIFYYI